MKIAGLVCWFFALSIVTGAAQAPAGPKEWTAWTRVVGDWAQFAVLSRFDSDAPPDEIAKKDPKSLKVSCLIAGKLQGDIPVELNGVKTFRLLYTEYGEFVMDGDFRESFLEVPYRSKGQYIPQVSIKRMASQFDIAEAGKPITEMEMTVTVPTFLNALGVGPLKGKIRGRRYSVGAEWRRKGKTVEIKIKDYRPEVPATPKPSP